MRREEDAGSESHHPLRRTIQTVEGHGGDRPSPSRRRAAVSSETLTVERGVTVDQIAEIPSRMNAAGETDAAKMMTTMRAQRRRKRRTIRTADVAEGVD